MKNNKVLEYNYVDVTKLSDGQSQYDEEYDIPEDNIVNARYIKTFRDQGNPLIEALPKPLGTTELIHLHTNMVSAPTNKEIQEMDTYEIIDSVEILNDFRIAFPFHLDVELAFYRSLCNSYRKRRIRKEQYAKINYVINNTEKIQHQLTEIKHVSDVASGFTLLGISGCGKSTAINMMLDRYPQVILHNAGTFEEFPQIVWLHVNATANSNFSLLYDSIGRAIDRALNNLTPIYENEMKKTRGLGAKYSKIREFVEKFRIGIIILDEIELMDTVSTRENSLETLMTLSNETGVAIAVVGTEDAYQGLFSKRRTARRTGILIQGSSYCENMKRFMFILKSLFSITWFKPESVSWLKKETDENGNDKITLGDIPKDIEKVFYQKTDGVISDIIGIYKEVVREYVRQHSIFGKYPVVDAEFIKQTADKYFEGLRQIAEKINETKLLNKQVREQALNLLNTPDEIMESEESERRFDNTVNSEIFHKEALMRENVITIISREGEYSKSSIGHAFLKAIANKNIETLSIQKAVEETLKILIEKSNRRNKRKLVEEEKSVDIKEKRKALLDTTTDDFE